MRSTRSRRTPRLTAGLTTLALTLGTVGAVTAAPATAAEAPEPYLHYTMEGISGTTLPDVSGNNLHGTLAGNRSVIEAEGGGAALDLHGGTNGGHVSVPRGALEGATDLTVSAHVRWDGSGGAWQRIFDLGTNTTRYLFATPSNGDGRLRTAVTTSGGGGETQANGYGPLKAGDWVTLTTTLDTSAQRVTMYLDGVAVASAPTSVTAGQLLTASAARAGWIGRSMYPDPLFDGAVADFRIYRAALSAEQVAELVGETPDVVALANETFQLRTLVGAAPNLPAAVRASFTDGYDRDVPVTWDAVDPAQYAQPGTYTVQGRAAGVTVTANVTVHRGELKVDLATNTGEFQGGASGLLYGLYADGMPTDNLVEGMNVRTVATKAQDGAQHPGSDALEVVRQLADTTDGDVYLRVTDYYRGFPYQWPGSTPAEKLADYARVLDEQLAMIGTLEPEYRDNLVIEPFNEPEGNMFGTGQWSLNRISWLNDPTDYFAAWDRTYRTIKEAYPDMRIAGPGTSILYPQVKGFLEHAVEAGTVPDIITWHELSHPQNIRDSVERYRGWEAEVFAGTELEGTELPINVNEYAFNYHTSVPGQMIQWMSAIEDSKVEAMIAFWNINGNLSDSAVQANRGNGQWWLYNAYAHMTGHTVEVTPPFPGQNYSLQGVATLDEERAVARTILGGADGAAPVELVNVPADVFGGDEVRVFVREIPWTGQLGDSAQPRHLAELTLPVTDGTVAVEFDGETLPLLEESSAYEVVVTPAGAGQSTTSTPTLWQGSYEAEDAAHTGSGYSRNGPEGRPQDVGKFYTSGMYNVGGLRTGSNVVLDFEVTVPQDGTYDLSVFANSLNTYNLVAEQGPTNVFLRVDGEAEQELFLPLGYKWVVWDHTDTTVELTAGTHTISLAARSLDGSKATKGDALIDRITLSLANPDADTSVYEAELAQLDGGSTVYSAPDGVDAATISGSGAVQLAEGESATFWVYGARDAEATLGADLLGAGAGTLAVNGRDVLDLARASEVAVHLEGGVNKVTVTGGAGGLVLDRLTVAAGNDSLPTTEYQAEDAELAGSAAVVDLPLAEGGKAVAGVGGEPGNDSALTFRVAAEEAGPHAVVVRFSNPEQVDGTHYNPNPVARHADISVNGGEPQRWMFVPTFHKNNFWERTIVLDLEAGENTISLRSEEATNWDGETYASETWPADYNLRADEAPIVDRITVSPLSAVSPVAVRAVTECRGKRAFVVVDVTNTSGAATDVAVTALGETRERDTLAAGKSWRLPFAADAASLEAGEVTVTASGVNTLHAYPEVTCG
ncbi:LamG-like jellyroll fold domain-containing protein [Isoptericola variabilis]|uniref:Ig domain protein n=1 Tax=Isoptericola variabilis (strain 225) TaxID=743718 RepID=F6FQT3_ISOV2|nr:LamG-like jellyroll fold domain-containing protein [Isoptericola variabilis]AEG42898.1 Ig domain protein [Isoptericola variabilis 225]